MLNPPTFVVTSKPSRRRSSASFARSSFFMIGELWILVELDIERLELGIDPLDVGIRRQRDLDVEEKERNEERSERRPNHGSATYHETEPVRSTSPEGGALCSSTHPM